MRTTVTLDPDVAAEIERVRAAEGRRFKQVLNDALRIGLRELSRTPGDHPFKSPTTPRNLGEPLIDITDTSAAIAEAEGERYR
ncbi:hypothetical protein ACX3O0_15150 [Homoserinimonas sp. A447]